MKGYCVFDNLQVHNVEKLEEYKKRVLPVVEKYDGRYIVLGGEFKVVEGNAKPTYMVVIEFPSYEIAQEWYNSQEYQEVKAIRLSAVEANGYIIAGV